MIPVDDLKAGDRILESERGDAVAVEILRGPEPCVDFFGRPMRRWWARREDTGAEGFVVYGPGAIDRTPA